MQFTFEILHFWFCQKPFSSRYWMRREKELTGIFSKWISLNSVNHDEIQKLVCLCLTPNRFKFFYNSSFSAELWQNPASIDIHWVATIECQCYQDSARIWYKMTNFRKTRLPVVVIKSEFPLTLGRYRLWASSVALQPQFTKSAKVWTGNSIGLFARNFGLSIQKKSPNESFLPIHLGMYLLYDIGCLW